MIFSSTCVLFIPEEGKLYLSEPRSVKKDRLMRNLWADNGSVWVLSMLKCGLLKHTVPNDRFCSLSATHTLEPFTSCLLYF